MPVDLMQSLWQEFAVESGEHLDRIEPMLVGIEAEATPVSADVVDTLFRSVHSIKGMAAALALRGMEQVSHHAEHLLGQARDERCTLDPPMAGMLLEALDELKRLRELSLTDRTDAAASEAVIKRLEQARSALELTAAPVADSLGAEVAAALAAVAALPDRNRNDNGVPPLHPDHVGLENFVSALRPEVPRLVSVIGPELEEIPIRTAARNTLALIRAGAEHLGFSQMARTAELLTGLIPFEGALDYYAREQAIDALADLRREIATLESATGSDGGGKALDEALNTALRIDFSARRRALADVLARYDREPAAFKPGGSAVTRAAELAGAIYSHFSFLYQANAGRLLLLIENALDHAARGEIVLTPELIGRIRKELLALAPVAGKRQSGIETETSEAALAELQNAIQNAAAAVAIGPTGVEDGVLLTARQLLEELGVTPDLISRLSATQLTEAAREVSSGKARLWEIIATLEDAEDKAERFAAWLDANARPLTSRALSTTSSLSFLFLLLTTRDDTAVLAALAGIDPDGRMLSARRCGAPTSPAPASPASTSPAPAPASVMAVPVPEPRPASPVPTPAAPVPAAPTTPEPIRTTSAAGGNILRVPGEVVDHFLSVIGEMVMVSGMIDDAVWGDDRHSRLAPDLRRLIKDMRTRGNVEADHLESLQRYAAGQDSRNRALRESRDRLAATLGRLQDAALELRVVPVETVFARLPRLARDLAATRGKQVRVEVDGRGVRIDKGMVDQLLDPLIHMVRNAIDHGMETPSERIAAGKAPAATLTVRADQRENRVVIEVTDDGRGLDAESIRSRAVERQLVGESTSHLMRDTDLFRLILLPGFSTADTVTETSGRGVGLDVVHTNVARLGGAIDIQSRPGQGATFTLRLPLSAAIQDVLVVEADSRLHAIPVRHLLELCSVQTADLQTVHGQTVILLHGALLPVHRLTGLLDGQAGALPRGDLPIVVLGDGRRRVGLQVDRVVRRQELFVRDIHPRIAAIPGIGGAALLGDGKVVLIVDGGDLFQLARLREQSVPAPPPRIAPGAMT
ncbi:MAG: ATP-binding protein [Rhodospirillaceae bacterium]